MLMAIQGFSSYSHSGADSIDSDQTFNRVLHTIIATFHQEAYQVPFIVDMQTM